MTHPALTSRAQREAVSRELRATRRTIQRYRSQERQAQAADDVFERDHARRMKRTYENILAGMLSMLETLAG